MKPRPFQVIPSVPSGAEFRITDDEQQALFSPTLLIFWGRWTFTLRSPIGRRYRLVQRIRPCDLPNVRLLYPRDNQTALNTKTGETLEYAPVRFLPP